MARTTPAPAAISRLLLCVLLLAATTSVEAGDNLLVIPGTPQPNSPFQLENFAAYPVGTFPDVWKVRGLAGDAAATYRVTEEEGRRFLAARANGNSVMIGLERGFDPSQYPYLRWDWRVRQLPDGADERVKDTNDSAAGVYVIFPGNFFMPRVLKYVWSSSAPVGTREPSPAATSTKIIVLESGADGATQWRTVTVNVKGDYLALFGTEPPVARGIGILTDANDTGSVAAADYTNFELLRIANDPVDPAVSRAESGRETSGSN
jgi:hypothetical protein